MRLIGAKLEAMITRILGVILAALAAQFVLDGLERSLPAWPAPLAHHLPHLERRVFGPKSTSAAATPGPCRVQLAVEAVRRFGHEDGRGRHVGADQQIIAAIFGDDPLRLRLVAAERLHHVGDRLVVAMIGSADRIVMRGNDQPRSEVDEGEDHPLGWH